MHERFEGSHLFFFFSFFRLLVLFPHSPQNNFISFQIFILIIIIMKRSRPIVSSCANGNKIMRRKSRIHIHTHTHTHSPITHKKHTKMCVFLATLTGFIYEIFFCTINQHNFHWYSDHVMCYLPCTHYVGQDGQDANSP